MALDDWEGAWAQRIADLFNEAAEQGFPVMGISLHGDEIHVSSYGGGVQYDTATVKKKDGRWAVVEGA